MDTRIALLERNISFLQQEHKDTLTQLHCEIDLLKRENKELQFKLIMDLPKPYRKASSHRCLMSQTETPKFLAGEGFYVEQMLEDGYLSKASELSSGPERKDSVPAETECASEGRGGLITSLQPLRIHCDPSQPPRAPTLQECEVIIRQLYNANSLQSQEILRIKGVLRDIVLNKKITPENYILTKAYLAEGSRTEEGHRFPKLTLQPLPQRPLPPQACIAERVMLPALKQSLSISIAERRKRTQAMQRTRLRRTLH